MCDVRELREFVAANFLFTDECALQDTDSFLDAGILDSMVFFRSFCSSKSGIASRCQTMKSCRQIWTRSRACNSSSNGNSAKAACPPSTATDACHWEDQLQLESFLEASAQRCPDKTALIVDGRRIGYGDIERRANQLAHALVERGVDRGDRVAIWLENSSDVIIALFAALKVGAVFVLVSPGTKGHKAAYILNDCRPRALITDRRRLRVIGEHWAGIPPIAVVWTVDPVADTAAPPHVASLQAVFDDRRPQPGTQKRAIDLDLASLIYTSGSTGTPKGVMMTHLNMISAATSIASYLESDSDDVILNVLPLSFDYGLYQILMAFRLGATVLLERSFAFPHLVTRRGCSRANHGPALGAHDRVDAPADGHQSGYDLSSLRCITNTGAALPPEHSRRLQESFPNARIFSMYGLTECKRCAVPAARSARAFGRRPSGGACPISRFRSSTRRAERSTPVPSANWSCADHTS